MTAAEQLALIKEIMDKWQNGPAWPVQDPYATLAKIAGVLA